MADLFYIKALCQMFHTCFTIMLQAFITNIWQSASKNCQHGKAPSIAGGALFQRNFEIIGHYSQPFWNAKPVAV